MITSDDKSLTDFIFKIITESTLKKLFGHSERNGVE